MGVLNVSVGSFFLRHFPLPSLAVLILCFGTTSISAQTFAELKHQIPWIGEPTFVLPPQENRPVPVGVGLHVHEITRIELREQTFTVLVTMTVRWEDPRLRYTLEGEANTPLVFHGNAAEKILENIWSPAVLLYNAIQVSPAVNSVLSVAPDGLVTLHRQLLIQAEYNAKFRAFPFDRQTMRIVVAPFGNVDRAITLEPLFLTVSEQNNDPVTVDYRLTKTQYGNVVVSTDNDDVDAMVFEIEVKRESLYYIWRNFLPLIAVMLISWSTFFMIDTQLHDRLMVVSIAILTAITFMLWLNLDLPRVPYLTIIGMFYALMSLLPVAAVVQSLILHHFVQSGQMDRAQRLEKRSRWVSAVYFFSVIAVIAVVAVALG